MTGERVVTENRFAGSGRAAKNRGREGHFFDICDYPRVRNGPDVVEPVNELGEHRPAIVLTHGFEDPYNMDHPPANHGTLEARVCAEESGYPAEGKGSRDDTPPVVILEPHEPEQCHFGSPVRFEITSIGERKRNGHGVDGCPATPCEYATDAGRSSERPIRASGASSSRKCSNALIRE
jgi:4-oxalomesaconate hydratase